MRGRTWSHLSSSVTIDILRSTTAEGDCRKKTPSMISMSVGPIFMIMNNVLACSVNVSVSACMSVMYQASGIAPPQENSAATHSSHPEPRSRRPRPLPRPGTNAGIP